MSEERMVAVVVVIAICAFSAMVLLSRVRSNFVINGEHYSQVGVMEINDNGSKVYTPVFKRIN